MPPGGRSQQTSTESNPASANNHRLENHRKSSASTRINIDLPIPLNETSKEKVAHQETLTETETELSSPKTPQSSGSGQPRDKLFAHIGAVGSRSRRHRWTILHYSPYKALWDWIILLL